MVNNTTTKVSYQGNGSTTVFSIPFLFTDKSYVKAAIYDQLTDITTVLTSDYYVDAIAKTLTYPGYAPGQEPAEEAQPPVLPSTSKITIYRETELSQLTDLGEKYPLPDIETMSDKLTQIAQEQSEKIDRCVKVDITSTQNPQELIDTIYAKTALCVEKATAAGNSAAAAANSQTAAANSASAALASQNAAALSETNAGTSATSASNSATAAGNSQTAAANSASAALASQNAAALSATNAGTSETNAGTSATAAGNSAAAAANSAAAAAAADARISDRWGLRKPDTTYAADDITYHVQLPTGWYLECSTGGTTANGDLTITSPTLNDTIIDGTVVWTIRKIGSGGDGAAVGDIKQIAYNGTVQAGWLLCDGAAVSRTMYPDLFAAVGTTYGAGDGSTTFNVPDYNAAERFVQGSSVAGTVKSAGLPNITGKSAGYTTTSGVASGGVSKFNSMFTGAFYGDANTELSEVAANATASLTAVSKFDASLSNPIYGASTTVQPNALTARYIIKAFDGQTADSALIDITQYANELAGKANRDLSNLSVAGEARLAHVVVDSYYDNTVTYGQNGQIWYRVYNDGWVEQGGIVNGNGVDVTFLKPMQDTLYTSLVTYAATMTGATGGTPTAANLKTTTGMRINNTGGYYCWYIAGMGANS